MLVASAPDMPLHLCRDASGEIVALLGDQPLAATFWTMDPGDFDHRRRVALVAETAVAGLWLAVCPDGLAIVTERGEAHCAVAFGTLVPLRSAGIFAFADCATAQIVVAEMSGHDATDKHAELGSRLAAMAEYLL